MNNEQFMEYSLYHLKLYALACELSQDLMNLVINYGDLPMLIERSMPNVLIGVLEDSKKEIRDIPRLLKEYENTLLSLDNVLNEVAKDKFKTWSNNNDG